MASIEAYAQGLLTMSVCAPSDMDPAEVTRQVNELYPTGISCEWTLDPAPAFATGQPHPNPCEQRDGHTHYLYEC